MSYSPSSSVVAARKVFAARLQEIRKNAGLTSAELSERCGWHKSKASRLQAGLAAPSETDIRSWCTACDAEGEAEDLVASARAVDTMYMDWRRMERSGLRQAQESVLGLYQRTRAFRVYASRVVPGMVQTREYTTAVLRAVQRSRVTADDVAAAVEARMERQRMLFSGNQTFALLIEESVLHSSVCDAETMRAQLRHLIAVSALARMSIGVLPLQQGRLRSPAEDFYMFDSLQTSVELISGHLRLTQPHEIAMYDQVFTELSQMAVYGAKARALITTVLESIG
ncbi:helix-turn-helix transcriptional regulator [Kitasatospora sp. NPDC028055]|uniref:helix-turn-helix domain-containing protein n=1 Tax=Kitasatospora sp. NPDC028055 TaxID=3155653 RepID=UPI0033D9BBB1